MRSLWLTLSLFAAAAGCRTAPAPVVDPFPAVPVPPLPFVATNEAEREAPATAPAVQDERARANAEGDRTAFVGIGFTDGPDTFLLGGEIDFHLDDQLSVGPLLQWGIDDEVNILMPSFQVKYAFPLDLSGTGPRFVPFVQGGAGICWIDVDGPGGADDDDTGFLLHVGGGLEARFEKILLASTMTFNMLPGEVLDESFIFAWQVVQIGFRF